MDACVGILIMTGANHSNGEHVPDLWSVKNCPLYRATIGVNRFCSILQFLRFDDKNTRATRLLTDKAAPISELWTMMNNNLAAHYKPSSCLTIDKQLFPYRGRTRFTQYIPSKPAKYGVKVWWICDATNAYPLHGQIYTGTRDNAEANADSVLDSSTSDSLNEISSPPPKKQKSLYLESLYQKLGAPMENLEKQMAAPAERCETD
ncbi:uncharacterized protein LOC126767216 [Bactrocera neohumeralis]|uniref:uncharacterized protein LOC126767216 n=1 Tax=Bactrocera neohumeralis TaxID=98809 RepID=UPI002165CC19|nr:uncharacterized protein LOC126767216 [Bactrocera neohumeralis]